MLGGVQHDFQLVIVDDGSRSRQLRSVAIREIDAWLVQFDPHRLEVDLSGDCARRTAGHSCEIEVAFIGRVGEQAEAAWGIPILDRRSESKMFPFTGNVACVEGAGHAVATMRRRSP